MVFINYKCPICGKILYHKDDDPFDIILNNMHNVSRYEPTIGNDLCSTKKTHDCLCKSGNQLIKYNFCGVSEEQIPGSEKLILDNLY